MKNGRMLLAAVAAKHPRPIACIGLLLSVLLFCNGCITRFHTTSFDVKHKPASSVSATNFRVQAVSEDQHDQEFEKAIKAELQKLEKGQNPSLPAVPYSVDLRYLGREETADGTKLLTGLLFLCSCFVFPHWDTTSHKWEISTTILGEKAEFRGERSSTDVSSWFMLPFGLSDVFVSDDFSSPFSESMAKAIFDFLTQARYEKAVSDMQRKAKQKLMGGKRLSVEEERLLENETSLESIVAKAKQPAHTNNALSALAQIDDPETLADIALHAAIPKIRKTAAQRVAGLPESRFAQLAAESDDTTAAKTFLDHVSDDGLLHRIVQNPSSAPETKSAAVRKIGPESVLADIAKAPGGTTAHKCLAVSRIGTESVLADIAAHAPDADVRKTAIGKIDNPAFLVASVAKDAEPENRLAALDRIKHPKALEAVVRKSGDVQVRLRAVRKITDPAVLKEVVATDANVAVRLAALEQPADQDAFRLAAETDSREAVRLRAVQGLRDQDSLATIVRQDAAVDVRMAAVAGINRQDVLRTVASSDKSAAVRAAAVAKVSNQDFLATAAQQDADVSVRREALRRVENQGVLAGIAKTDPDAENRLLAIQRLEDETALREIALKEQHKPAREAAIEKLPAASREMVLDTLRRAEEAEEAVAVRNALAKAKRAQEDGAINFFGFYIGMPEADAKLLAKHYGLHDGEWWCKCPNKSRPSTVEVLHFSLEGLRRVTKGGNSFKELAQVVANHVGTLTLEREQFAVSSGDTAEDFINLLAGNVKTRVGEYYKYNTIDGIYVVVVEESLGKILNVEGASAEIPAGFLMWDNKP